MGGVWEKKEAMASSEQEGLWLGVDVGTSKVACVVWDGAGAVCAAGSAPVPGAPGACGEEDRGCRAWECGAIIGAVAEALGAVVEHIESEF